MNKVQSLTLLLKFTFTAFLFFVIANKTDAQTLVYSDYFENNTVGYSLNYWHIIMNVQWNNHSATCKNGTQDATWLVSEYNGSKAVSITINRPGCITEIVPSSFKIPNTSHYRYIVGVSFPVLVFKESQNI